MAVGRSGRGDGGAAPHAGRGWAREAPALFKFMMDAGPITRREAHATFNLGIRFTAYVASEAADVVVAAARACGHEAWRRSGKKDGTRKAVTIPSRGLEYDGSPLQVR